MPPSYNIKSSSSFKRINWLFEFEDLTWFPNLLRECMMDCLRFNIIHSNIYAPITSLIVEGMQRTNTNRMIDLCSGGGGAVEVIHQQLKEQVKNNIQITLTDKFPNVEAFQFIQEKSNGEISYTAQPVDAMKVPSTLSGFRTMFTAFHHFNPNHAKQVLRNAVDANSGIGIFDGGNRSVIFILGLILVHPFIFLFFTPFFKPFRWSRLFFTYLIPIIPCCQIWDGVMSVLKLYEPHEMLQLALEVSPNNYHWEAGRRKNEWGVAVNYLLGYPKENKQ
jgi:hypothetical protein